LPLGQHALSRPSPRDKFQSPNHEPLASSYAAKIQINGG